MRLLSTGAPVATNLPSPSLLPFRLPRRDLILVGDAPCLWLEAAEPETAAGSLPRDLPLARCRAGVNTHLFTLWRACCRSMDPGLGSADVSACLVRLLQVVHAKARAALAGDATRRWARAGAAVGADVAEKMQLAVEHDVDTFGARAALTVLGDVRLSLACLHFNQAAADTAMAHAEHAAVPPEFAGEWGAELMWAKQRELQDKKAVEQLGSEHWRRDAEEQLAAAQVRQLPSLHSR